MASSSITLTREDELRLAAVAETVVKNTVNEYNELLTVHNSVVDERRWKKIKQRDDMRVYRERSPSLDGTTTGASRGDVQSNHSKSHSSSEADMENLDDWKSIASMIAFGSVEGSLDDVMYGAINPTEEAMQLKTAYVGDGFVVWELLASIITPSEHDPFRELTIKHLVKRHPLLLSAVHRRRSVQYIESNGIAQTPNGERIGYHLHHSVDFPGHCEPPDPSTVRAKLSFCFLFRQRRPNCVEVFTRGFIDPMNDAPTSISALTSAEVALSVGRNTYCAEMKKFTRILSSQPAAVRAVVSSSSSASGGGSSSSGGVGDVDRSTTAKSADRQVSCSQCSQKIPNKLKLFGSSSKEKNCAMCGSRLCSNCRVYKTLFTPSVTKEKKALTQSSRAFCTNCITCVVGAWSAKFAVLDARAAGGEQVDYASALNMSTPEASRLRKIPE